MSEPNKPAADHKPTIILVGAHDIEASIVRRQIDGIAELVSAEPSLAADMIRERTPYVALLFIDHQREVVLQLCRTLSAGNVTCVVVSRDRDPSTILLAMRSGARDFAYLEGDDNDVRRAVQAIPLAPSATASQRRGVVFAVFSCKGGSGATTIATNLAAAILEADARQRVVLLDIDAQLGDVATFLDLPVKYSWAELLANMARLDDELVHQSLTTHATGLQVVAQTGEAEDADLIDANAVTKTIVFLRQHYDVVIIDGLRDFRDTAIAALDCADRAIVTMTQDVPALKNASKCLAVFRRLGYGQDKLALIVNRHHKRSKLDLDTIADALGRSIDATIANDFPAASESVNEGVLLTKSAPHAHITNDIRSLVGALGLPHAESKRGWFRRAR